MLHLPRVLHKGTFPQYQLCTQGTNCVIFVHHTRDPDAHAKVNQGVSVNLVSSPMSRC